MRWAPPPSSSRTTCQESLDIVDYVYFMSDGVIVAHGTPDELRASDEPFVHQFVHGEADGPVPFHYPAADYARGPERRGSVLTAMIDLLDSLRRIGAISAVDRLGFASALSAADAAAIRA